MSWLRHGRYLNSIARSRPAGFLQRKCACGNAASLADEECDQCKRKRALGLQPRPAVDPAQDEQQAQGTPDSMAASLSGPLPVSATPGIDHQPTFDGTAHEAPLEVEHGPSPGSEKGLIGGIEQSDETNSRHTDDAQARWALKVLERINP